VRNLDNFTRFHRKNLVCDFAGLVKVCNYLDIPNLDKLIVRFANLDFDINSMGVVVGFLAYFFNEAV
jgi:hypothetical protein